MAYGVNDPLDHHGTRFPPFVKLMKTGSSDCVAGLPYSDGYANTFFAASVPHRLQDPAQTKTNSAKRG